MTEEFVVEWRLRLVRLLVTLEGSRLASADMPFVDAVIEGDAREPFACKGLFGTSTLILELATLVPGVMGELPPTLLGTHLQVQQKQDIYNNTVFHSKLHLMWYIRLTTSIDGSLCSCKEPIVVGQPRWLSGYGD